MFLGHALLGFALAGGFALIAGWERERAVAFGVVTAAFAAAPDVDMVYAVVGAGEALLSAAGGFAVVESFWETGNVVHRSVTHSLPVALPVAVAVGLWTWGRRHSESLAEVREAGTTDVGMARTQDGADGGVNEGDDEGVAPRSRPWAVAIGTVSVLVALSTVVTLLSGLLGGAIVAIFALASLVIAESTVRRTTLEPRVVVGAALVGIGSHPFGDLLTGEPPALLYPFDVTFISERVVLSADPTLHLLGAFGVELTAIWLGVAVFLQLYRVPSRVALAPRATLGAGYAAGVLVLPAPTLEVSYPFVFTVLAVGLLGLTPRFRLKSDPGRPRIELPNGTVAAVTGLSAVTVAWAAYSVTYLLL